MVEWLMQKCTFQIGTINNPFLFHKGTTSDTKAFSDTTIFRVWFKTANETQIWTLNHSLSCTIHCTLNNIKAWQNKKNQTNKKKTILKISFTGSTAAPLLPTVYIHVLLNSNKNAVFVTGSSAKRILFCFINCFVYNLIRFLHGNEMAANT